MKHLILLLTIVILVSNACKKKEEEPTPQQTKVDLVSPVNGTTNLPISQTLSCTSVPDGISYKFEITNINDPSNYYSYTSISNSYTITNLREGQSYRWYVYATTSNGTAYVSPTWTFSTGGVYLGFTLITPLDNTTNILGTHTFTCTPLAGTTNYRFLATCPLGNSEINTSVPTATFTDLISGQNYLWSVEARDAGLTYTNSPFWHFSTIALPTLISPPNSTIGTGSNPTFTWSAVTGATAYEAQLSINSDFSTVISTITSATTSYTIPASTPLPINGYYWRVRVQGTNTWSAPFYFFV